jgi:hypothetical protein
MGRCGLHPLLWTESSRIYVASLCSGKRHGDATASRASGDLWKTRWSCWSALQQAVERGVQRPDALALHHLAVGFGLL